MPSDLVYSYRSCANALGERYTVVTIPFTHNEIKSIMPLPAKRELHIPRSASRYAARSITSLSFDDGCIFVLLRKCTGYTQERMTYFKSESHMESVPSRDSSLNPVRS